MPSAIPGEEVRSTCRPWRSMARSASRSPTPGRGSRRRTSPIFLKSSTRSRGQSEAGPGWAWRSSGRSSWPTAAGSRRPAVPARGPASRSRCREPHARPRPSCWGMEHSTVGNRPSRILIVDDEPNVRLVIRTALEAAGHLVSEASDGPTALDLLGREGLDLALLDLRMPDVDGMEVLRRLRDAGNDVPVVIVSAHGSIPDVVGAMRLGAVDFLPKPVTPAAIREVVDRLARPYDGRPGTVGRES